MKVFFLILYILSAFTVSVVAQLNIGGKPLSFDNKILSENINIPVVEFSELDNEKLSGEAYKNQRKDQPWQFGLNRDISIDIKTASHVDQLKTGKLYRLYIYSKNALTLNFRFDIFKIPENAVLYIYNKEKNDILGGFTSKNNQDDGIFATSLIKGDQVTIEYFEPDNAAFRGELILSQVTHGFRTLSDYSKSFGQSGECNMNTACPDAEDWSDEIRSVCMLLTGGSGFCSAALINNTLSDGTPYVLSADHCYKNPGSIVFIFNWESETCENPNLSPSHNDLSGATLIARNAESDFFLMKMNNLPPAEYNVYYSGWFNENSVAVSTVCIHHPSADIKKISFDDNQSESDYYLGSLNPPDSHWKVIWDRNTTTEGGSSGSPLFNQNHRIIGQLHGGFASCDNLDEPDWYGKFSYSWNTGNEPETRLKDWLDPINTNISDMHGYDPNLPLYDIDLQILSINSPEQNNFEVSEITPSFKIRNIGNNPISFFKIKYFVDDDLYNEFRWTGNLNSGDIVDIELNTLPVNGGKHNIKAYVTEPNGFEDQFHYNDTINKEFIVYEAIFKDNFDKGKFWYLTGEFEINKPMGKGGQTGLHDPDTAYSGENVLGTDLSGLGQFPGDYEENLGFYEEYALSPTINCTDYEDVILKFQRYIDVETTINDNASIEIYNGDFWQAIWSNSNITIQDSTWTEQIIEISEFADTNVVNFRFIIGPTNDYLQYCGWNIDNFEIYGLKKNFITSDEKPLKIYPNPATNYFYCEFIESNIDNARISISDISGKLTYEKSYSKNEIIQTDANDNNLIYIEHKNSEKGLYFINIKTDKDTYTGKIILY